MKAIDFKLLLKIEGLIMVIISATFLLCLPVAVIYSESVLPFVYSSVITLVPGLLLFFLMPSSINETINNREGSLSVTLAWVILTLSGTLPYLISGTIPDFVHALFESTSGFTTTGATILSNVEIIPKSILFWRSLTHWIGGIGIILLVLIILPSLKIGGYNLFSLENSLKQKILPKTKSIAITFLLIYLAISTVELILLLLGGLGLFESLCITFGTVATGGFSVRNTSLADLTPYIQYVVAIFMFLSATSFTLYFFLLKGYFKKIRQNEEFWYYVFFTTASVVFITLTLYFYTDRDFGTSFRHSFFQVIAQITTTGFATTDYMAWPAVGWFFMFLLLFAGGSTGSTTGGIKMARQLIALKNIKNVFVRLQHPNIISPVKLNDKIVSESNNFLMLLFMLLYIGFFIAGSIVLVLSGVPVNEAAGASVSSLSNVGPGLGASGNMGNYAAFNNTALGTMTVLMVTGRLEIFTIMMIFTRSFWRI